MEILQSVEDLKSKIMQRQDFIQQKKALLSRVADGRTFFAQQAQKPSAQSLLSGIKQITSYLDEIEEIDKEIFALDTIICSRLEMEFLDSIIKVRTRRSQNEAGDTIKPTEFFFLPEDFGSRELVSISENDLWFLKMAKSAFSVQNIEIIKKGE